MARNGCVRCILISLLGLRFTTLGCQADCAPTFEMLATSEMPTEVEFYNFGPGTGSSGAQPDSSLCTIA